MLTGKITRSTLAAGACAISFSAHAAVSLPQVQAPGRAVSSEDALGGLQPAQSDQTASTTPPSSGGQSAASTGGQAASPQDSSAPGTPDGDIVVTAQRRSERLQNVPISIAVLGGADLDKSSLRNAADALRTVAGVSIMEAYQGGGSLVTDRKSVV